jgi:triphosphoribosyl-dephospho-CoA synthase
MHSSARPAREFVSPGIPLHGDHLPLSTGGCRTIARLALRALHQELSAYPKPGLVSPTDSGSHDDMDASTFFRSLLSLRSYFMEISLAGMRSAPFTDLKNLGIAAEARMLQATGGINTHRGGIFNLGLLAAAAGALQAGNHGMQGDTLGSYVHHTWGIAIRSHGAALPKTSHGGQVVLRYGVGGVIEEAAQGFPHLFGTGLPVLQSSLAAGATLHDATVQCLFALIAVLPDSNLLYRGGTTGLEFAQRSARDFLEAGGIQRGGWQTTAVQLHRQFVARRLSPGGSADLLAATLFVHWLQAAS